VTAPFVDPSSLLPVLPGGTGAAYPYRPVMAGRLLTYNTSTRVNTVRIAGTTWTDLPILSPAEATLTAGVTVLCAPLQDGYVILGRMRVP
jgi:hypothetical protein